MATTTFNDLITFSRGSNATLVGPNGLVQWAPNNLLTNSESFEAAAWFKSAVTASANTTTAPDGTRTADTITEDTSTGTHIVRFQPFTVTSGITYTASVYVKANGRNRVRLINFDNVSAIVSIFDLSTGTVASGTGAILSVGDGWYRITQTFTGVSTAATNFAYQISLDDGTTNSYTGNGTSGIFVWGAQLELGSTATTYNNTSVRNLLGFSEAFDNAAWTKGGSSIVTGAQANPLNGLFNAQKLMEDTATGTHRTFAAVTTVAQPYTFSVYAKAAGRSWVYLRIDRNGGATPQAWFNLATGAVGTVQTGLTANIQSVGNGWYRCAITVDAAVAGVCNQLLGLASADNTISYTGDGNSGVFIYGAQLSNSASLDPYVPTPGAAPSSTAYFGPRFDFDPVTLQPRGLLIEEQRTNRTLQSEDFTAAPWAAAVSGTSTRVNTNSALGFMRGLVTATSATGGIRQTHSGLASGQVYALSFYIQSASTSVQIVFENGTAGFGSGHNVTINPSNGTAGVLTGFTSVSVQPFQSGYIYTLITAPAGGLLLANIEWRITNSGDSIQLGRPQFEAGAFATSYIPTIASTVTRSADVATISGQNFSQWYNQSEGTFVVDASTVEANTANRSVYWASNAGNTDIVYGVAGTSRTLRVFAGGVETASISAGTFTNNVPAKTAGAYRVNDFAASFNGGTVGTDTTGAVPTGIDRMALGGSTSLAATNQLNGHIRSIRYYPVRAADFQLQALTT